MSTITITDHQRKALIYIRNATDRLHLEYLRQGMMAGSKHLPRPTASALVKLGLAEKRADQSLGWVERYFITDAGRTALQSPR